VLGILALLAIGFVGGTQVQKQWGTNSTQTQSSPFARMAGGFPQGGGSGNPFEGGTGQQSGTRGDASSAATTETVKLVDGDAVFVRTTDGQTITVKAGSDTSVLVAGKGSLKDLKKGCTATWTARVAFESVVDAEAAELADHRGVAVVDEQRAAGVHGGDLDHLAVGEGEVEDVEVLLHPVGPYRLGDDDHTALDEPAGRPRNRRAKDGATAA
jgi:hypothetical protein